MKRIFLLIFAILLLLGALTFFTYSTETLAEDQQPETADVTTTTTKAPVSFPAETAKPEPTVATETAAEPAKETPQTEAASTAQTTTSGEKTTAAVAAGVLPANVEPVAPEEPKQISAKPVEIPKHVETSTQTSVATQVPLTEQTPSVVAPSATESADSNTSQTFKESMGITAQTATSNQPSATAPAPATPVVTPPTPIAPAQAVEKALAEAAGEGSGLPSCSVLCQKVCTGLQDQAATELEEEIAPKA